MDLLGTEWVINTGLCAYQRIIFKENGVLYLQGASGEGSSEGNTWKSDGVEVNIVLDSDSLSGKIVTDFRIDLSGKTKSGFERKFTCHKTRNKIENLKLDNVEFNFSFFQNTYTDFRNSLIKAANDFFVSRDYENALELYEIINNSDEKFEVLNHLKSIVLFKYPNANLNDSNPVYKKIDALYESYDRKATSWFERKSESMERSLKNLDNSSLGFEEEIELEIYGASREESNAFNLRMSTGEHVFGFGKYKGISVIDIINRDPDYICWCTVNLTSFCVQPTLLLMDNLRKEKLYYETVIVSLIKCQLICKWKSDYNEDSQSYDNEKTSGGHWRKYTVQNMIDDAFEGDASNLWNVD